MLERIGRAELRRRPAGALDPQRHVAAHHRATDQEIVQRTEVVVVQVADEHLVEIVVGGSVIFSPGCQRKFKLMNKVGP